MKTNIKGEVLVLGNNIDTDQIYPGNLLAITNPEEIGSYCLSGIDPIYAKKFKKGGIIVAGTNFGCGSSREHAPISLLNMGASIVIADSFARIFFRNSINLGLPLLVCKGLSHLLKNGDKIEADIADGIISIAKTGKILNAEKIGDYAMKMLEVGGIKPLFCKRTVEGFYTKI